MADQMRWTISDDLNTMYAGGVTFPLSDATAEAKRFFTRIGAKVMLQRANAGKQAKAGYSKEEQAANMKNMWALFCRDDCRMTVSETKELHWFNPDKPKGLTPEQKAAREAQKAKDRAVRANIDAALKAGDVDNLTMMKSLGIITEDEFNLAVPSKLRKKA